MKLQDPRWLVVLLSLAAAVWPASAGEPALDLLPASLRERLQQTQASLPVDGWARLQSLPPGMMLRVALKRARVLRGKLVSVTDEALTLRVSHKKLRTEPRSQVVRVHRRHHDPLSNGVLIGLGVGAAGGAVVGASLDPASTDYARSGAVLFLGLFGAGVGAAIGAFADMARVEFELIYERPTHTRLRQRAAPVRPWRRSLFTWLPPVARGCIRQPLPGPATPGD